MATPGSIFVGEQGLQLVKGTWARILVGKDKTRAALYGAKEKAGAGKRKACFDLLCQRTGSVETNPFFVRGGRVAGSRVRSKGTKAAGVHAEWPVWHDRRARGSQTHQDAPS